MHKAAAESNRVVGLRAGMRDDRRMPWRGVPVVGAEQRFANGSTEALPELARVYDGSSQARGIVVVGAAGVGKTVLVRNVAQSYSADRRGDPTIWVDVPKLPTPQSLTRAIRAECWRPDHPDDATMLLTHQLSLVHVWHGRRVLVLDDAHNLVERRMGGFLRSAAEILARVLTSTPLSIVCVGRPEVLALVDRHPVLGTHCQCTVPLDRSNG
jgi:type II secretory pathway predicted ATPase ExeA